MKTVEISVGKCKGQVDQNFFLIMFSALYFHLFCYSTGKIQVDVYVTFRGRIQLKFRAGA